MNDRKSKRADRRGMMKQRQGDTKKLRKRGEREEEEERKGIKTGGNGAKKKGEEKRDKVWRWSEKEMLKSDTHTQTHT